MKTYALCTFAASLLAICNAGFAQTPAGIDSHIAAGKAAAGLDFRGTFVNLCLPGAAPGGARGTPARGADGRGAAAAPATPDRTEWYASPYKVFDNLYWLGTRQHSSWALRTSGGIIGTVLHRHDGMCTGVQSAFRRQIEMMPVDDRRTI
jgi:hypothetical protein